MADSGFTIQESYKTNETLSHRLEAWCWNTGMNKSQTIRYALQFLFANHAGKTRNTKKNHLIPNDY